MILQRRVFMQDGGIPIPDLAPFNPADKSGGILLLNNNYQSYSTANLQTHSVRCTAGKTQSAGATKYYFEFSFPSAFASQTEARGGVKRSIASLTATDYSAYLMRASTTTMSVTVGTPLVGTYAAGHTIDSTTRGRVCLDMASGKMWAGCGHPSIGEVWFNSGDPDAGTGQVATLTLGVGGIWHKSGMHFYDSANGIKHLLLAQQPVYSIPATASHWSV